MEGGHLSEFVPIGTASAITKKHRNQQLTDYGAKIE